MGMEYRAPKEAIIESVPPIVDNNWA